MIILGVDLGNRRIGFALCDEEERLAFNYGTAFVKDFQTSEKAVLEKIEISKCSLVVIGHPLTLEGKSGPQAKSCELFAKHLQSLGHEVILWDERLTSVEADRLLKSASLNRKQRQKLVDTNAAQCLLSSYLSWRKHKGL